MARTPAVAALAIALLASPAGAAADVIPGQVVVRFASDAASAQRADALDGIHGATSVRLPIPDARVVDLPQGETVADAITHLKRDPAVRWAEANDVISASRTPDDPDFGQLWGLQNLGQTVSGVAGTAGVDIGASAAWETTTGDPSVLVGVADTGVEADHPDLTANVRTDLARDVVASGNQHNANIDPQGHGTHVAGTIGAVGNNGLGVSGVDWRVGIVPIRVLGATGGGTSADLAAGLAYAGASGVPVVNASLGGSFPTPPQVVEDAVAQSPKTLFVVAAGNSASDNDAPGRAVYPCDFRETNLVCVASINSTGALSTSSNYGTASVDLAAPGQSIESTFPSLDTVWDDDFSTPIAGRWTTSGTNDNWGLYDTGGGSFVLASSQDGSSYLPHTESFAQIADPLNFTGKVGCVLTGTYSLDTGDGESALTIERSLDELTWTPLFSTSESTDFASLAVELGADGASAVRLRLHFTTAGTVTPHTGVQVYQLHLRCVDAGGADYRFLSGTSMATPQVAGAAALLLARHPTLSTAQLRAALLRSVTPLPALDGKTVTGGMLNVPGALAAAAPQPAESPAGPATPPTSTTGTTTTPATTTTATSPATTPLAPFALGAPALRLRARGVQRVTRTHAVVTGITSDQNALLTATGTVSLGRGTGAGRAGRLRLRAVHGHITANHPTTLKLRLASATLTRVRDALHRHRRPTARVVLRAGSPAGSTTTRLRPIRLT